MAMMFRELLLMFASRKEYLFRLLAQGKGDG